MAIDTLEYPELHDESIPTLAFIKHLNRLLVAAGIKDFTLQVHHFPYSCMKPTNHSLLLPYLSFETVHFAAQDLYKPDSNRLRRNLSGIINFAKFREEKLVPYTDMQESVEHLLEDTADLEERNLKLVCTCTFTCTLVPHATIQSDFYSCICSTLLR